MSLLDPQLFTTFSWGISAMARLSFGFLDYDEFVNVSVTP